MIELRTRSTSILGMRTSWRCSSLRSSEISCRGGGEWQVFILKAPWRTRLLRCGPAVTLSCKINHRSRMWRVKKIREEVQILWINIKWNWRGRMRYSSIERGSRRISKRNNKRWTRRKSSSSWAELPSWLVCPAQEGLWDSRRPKDTASFIEEASRRITWRHQVALNCSKLKINQVKFSIKHYHLKLNKFQTQITKSWQCLWLSSLNPVSNKPRNWCQEKMRNRS